MKTLFALCFVGLLLVSAVSSAPRTVKREGCPDMDPLKVYEGGNTSFILPVDTRQIVVNMCQKDKCIDYHLANGSVRNISNDTWLSLTSQNLTMWNLREKNEFDIRIEKPLDGTCLAQVTIIPQGPSSSWSTLSSSVPSQKSPHSEITMRPSTPSQTSSKTFAIGLPIGIVLVVILPPLICLIVKKELYLPVIHWVKKPKAAVMNPLSTSAAAESEPCMNGSLPHQEMESQV
ncbi:uncharacterized protein LOC128345414 [Hemicordylus capensis]|uniref:uncharacterized protein LOC128345414 n=1 Tax=Hemicordylus capensis TaxID=884348 RepID=UPI0023026CF3|nr:uncharacterized protein LOC128345414 [Hemicordylus capensis]